MTWVVVLVNVVLHFAVSLALIAWLASARRTTRVYTLALAAFTLLHLVVIHRVGAAWSWFGSRSGTTRLYAPP